ncbi:MAG: 3-deoxy-manno-octulosonate cytidylyltransferase (CMP-KDO synthetase) [Francisellaceae bacterium]|jgi:3-deoxy-manno-octulosonate cytidylyltransferase (CMP-KDO synthetase)
MWMEVGVLGNNIKVLCIIPARYHSTRFPGKPLIEINGIPMIKRTYSQAAKSSALTDLVVATENQKIVDYCKSEGLSVVMTSDDCLTGTDRLAEVAKKQEYKGYDLYINVQGDEPVIDSIVIDQIITQYKIHGNKYIAYNLYKIICDQSEINSDSIIKVIVNQDDELMYMSRLPVPYSKSKLAAVYKMQVPVYGYTAEALEVFSAHQKTINEKFEDVELLRFVDLGYKLKMTETKATSIAVDVPNDLLKVEAYLCE